MRLHQTPKQRLVGIWHRRIGFLITGMLLVFAISGIALNHQSHWDPYYAVSESYDSVEDLKPSMSNEEIDLYIRERYGVEENLNSSFWESSRSVSMSYANGISFIIDFQDNSIVQTVTKKRFGLYNLIHLHLNGVKGLWIPAADVVSIGLILLCLSGIYLVWGRYTRDEYVLLITGIILPVLFYLYL